MSNDLGPGKLPQGPVALFLLKAPSVLSAKSLPPIFCRAPPPRFPRVTSLHVALSTLIHEMIQVAKHLLGHANTEGIAPAPAHRMHLVDQGDRGRTHVLTPDAFARPLHVLDGARPRLNRQFVAAARAIGRRRMADVARSCVGHKTARSAAYLTNAEVPRSTPWDI